MRIADPSIMSDGRRYVELSREYATVKMLMDLKSAYDRTCAAIEEARTLLQSESDEELRKLAREELSASTERLPGIEESLKLLLMPVDPQDVRNAIVEIRSGTGGDEASLFAGDLYKMYIKFCESKGWRVSVTHYSEGTLGGYKEIIFAVSGEGVYGLLKYESGVHRVQRVPQTEAQGRVHTSAATVAVLPEADELDVEINEKRDIRRDEFCSSGAGGQSVNTTYSAIRLTHIPTGIVVQCQDERSKLRNYDKALAELRARLYRYESERRDMEVASQRRSMVSSGDRSAKIRTYNYPQGRITDHRINYTLYNLPSFMGGDIEGCINRLRLADGEMQLKSRVI
jgi:peptide chain release factor 1